MGKLPSHVDRRVDLSVTISPTTKARLLELAKERKTVVGRLIDSMMDDYWENIHLVKKDG